MDWVNDNTGTGKHLSDLANGATDGSTDSGWGYTPGYYARNKENRTAELFANVMAVAGEGEFSTALLRRFFPCLSGLDPQLRLRDAPVQIVLQQQVKSEKFWVVTNGKFTVATNSCTCATRPGCGCRN